MMCGDQIGAGELERDPFIESGFIFTVKPVSVSLHEWIA